MDLNLEAPQNTDTGAWNVHRPDNRAHIIGVSQVPSQRATLRRLLAGSGLRTCYQPMVDMNTRHVVALEALVRLRLSRHVTLFPADFLPQVEALGLAGALTDAVASRALNDWAVLGEPAHRPMLSINFSLDVLLSPSALSRLDERRAAAGIAARSVLIELTESRPVDNLVRLRRSVERFRKAGYAIALDDITPSVPHLESLIDMPFTDLKLDKAVIQAAPHWPDAVKFIEHMAKRARSHNMAVTAEGVEDQVTWTMMRSLGIRFAQGFLISEPLLAEDISGWRNEWTARRAA